LEDSEKLNYSSSDLDSIKNKTENALKATIGGSIWGDDVFYKILNQSDTEIIIATKTLNN